jgi:hypothetical protein
MGESSTEGKETVIMLVGLRLPFLRRSARVSALAGLRSQAQQGPRQRTHRGRRAGLSYPWKLVIGHQPVILRGALNATIL